MKMGRIMRVFALCTASEKDLQHKENSCAPSGGVHVRLTAPGLGKQMQQTWRQAAEKTPCNVLLEEAK